MSWYNLLKIAKEDEQKEMWGDDFFGKILKKKKIINKEKKAKPLIINLYRNFDANLDDIKKTNDGNYILSPKKGEQNVLWFAHDLQGSPERYYNRGAKYLLTFPLQVTKHYELITWDDGSTSEYPIIDDNNYGLENNNKWMGYELPEGFQFSYKTEKHIICDHELTINPQQITIFSQDNYELV